MDKGKMLEYYCSREPFIFNEVAGTDAQYQTLLRRKLDAEKTLQRIAGEQVWKQYLALDNACNELESLRYQILYLAGAADYEKLLCEI